MTDEEQLYQAYVNDLKNRSYRTPIQKNIILPTLKELQAGIEQNDIGIVCKAILNIHLIECNIPI